VALTEEEDKGRVGRAAGHKDKQARRLDGPSWPGGPRKGDGELADSSGLCFC
jgi:hypothetical protein